MSLPSKRGGMRALILSPVDRKIILMGKIFIRQRFSRWSFLSVCSPLTTLYFGISPPGTFCFC